MFEAGVGEGVGPGDRGARARNSHTWSANQQGLWGQKAGKLHLETNKHIITQNGQTAEDRRSHERKPRSLLQDFS